MWPTGPINVRTAVRDTCIPIGGGPDGKSPVFVPKDADVVYSVWVMQRREDIYGSDAAEFRPERWLEEVNGESLKPGWGFLPFNGGPRLCLGQQYALNLISYVIVRMVQTFSEMESRDEVPWTESLGLTLASAHGTKVGLTAR